jgi:hypothetical protein
MACAFSPSYLLGRLKQEDGVQHSETPSEEKEIDLIIIEESMACCCFSLQDII